MGIGESDVSHEYAAVDKSLYDLTVKSPRNFYFGAKEISKIAKLSIAKVESVLETMVYTGKVNKISGKTGLKILGTDKVDLYRANIGGCGTSI